MEFSADEKLQLKSLSTNPVFKKLITVLTLEAMSEEDLLVEPKYMDRANADYFRLYWSAKRKALSDILEETKRISEDISD